MSSEPNAVPTPLAQEMILALRGPRAADPPHDFHAEMDNASPDSLARAGVDALRHALARGDEPGAAFELLVADALITEACAQAALQGIPAALDAAHFAALLEAR